MNHYCAKFFDNGRTPVLLLLLLALTACATHEEEGMVEAATSPLSDLNLLQKKIPEVLKEAVLEPYALPSVPTCDAIEVEISELDHVLGINGALGGANLKEKGKKVAGTAAVDAVRRTTQGIMPMRDWVRKLTGAEKHSRQVSEAISAGLMRRSFLIGYSVAKGCVEEENEEGDQMLEGIN